VAKQITLLSIFLASPSDLAEERMAVKRAVDELNGIVKQTMNVQLEILMWETDSYPSVGIDAQDIINSQIGDDYDIFIGMMWQKFGTPTGRAGSGTEEEFERAYNRFVETKGKTKIMLYFGSKPISPDEIDIDQLSKVKAFKKKVESMGVLYGSFSDVDTFEKILKIHLTKHLSDIVKTAEKKSDVIAASPIVAVKSTIDLDGDDENGYLDLVEIFSENFSQVEKVLIKMSSYIEDLGEQMDRKSAKLDALNKIPNGRSTQSFRVLIDSVASDIMNYVNLTNIELARYHDLFTSGIDAFSAALTIEETSNGKKDAEELQELIDAIDFTKSSISGASGSIDNMRKITSDFPPIAKTINKATRLLRVTLENVVAEFAESINLFDNLREVISSSLAQIRDGESEAEVLD
jgi:hypothetical protein